MPVLIVVALSARALAQAARRAGYAPVAIDAFADEDTRKACLESVKLEGAMGGAGLEPQVARLASIHRPVGIVFGSGFDDCPEALAPLAGYAPLLGSWEAMARAKVPLGFAAACNAAGLAHPETRLSPQRDGWLAKRRGGSGGGHILPAEVGLDGTDVYWQRRVAGRPISLLFTCGGGGLIPLGWSAQWADPAPGAPYRYGGAAGPLDFEPPENWLARLADLAQALGVKGLASADCLDDGAALWLLEINPRPGATLDVFDADDDPLVARHIAACRGGAASPSRARAQKAAVIVYAERDLTAPQDWPDWIADRPAPGEAIPAGAPVCTVLAQGAGARDLATARANEIKAKLWEGTL